MVVTAFLVVGNIQAIAVNEIADQIRFGVFKTRVANFECYGFASTLLRPVKLAPGQHLTFSSGITCARINSTIFRDDLVRLPQKDEFDFQVHLNQNRFAKVKVNLSALPIEKLSLNGSEVSIFKNSTGHLEIRSSEKLGSIRINGVFPTVQGENALWFNNVWKGLKPKRTLLIESTQSYLLGSSKSRTYKVQSIPSIELPKDELDIYKYPNFVSGHRTSDLPASVRELLK